MAANQPAAPVPVYGVLDANALLPRFNFARCLTKKAKQARSTSCRIT